LKQVPAGEYDPAEFVKTNIMGSMNVVEAALWAGVEKALALSSDKAVAPLNNYGSTKRCMETLFMAANAYRGPKSYPAYSCTRYGNVAGSAASVIPIFREKQAAGEPLPITDERMSRFHMTMDDAVDFVLMALDRMQGGEIYIPKLPSFRVTHLAEAFGGRREIIGLRPGEKLAEVLISRDESFNAYDLGDCYALASRELGERVPDVPGGFQLASDDNNRWLGVGELKQALEAL
jgi:UDP-N-acetylglucosamine 4,6-dehydratase